MGEYPRRSDVRNTVRAPPPLGTAPDAGKMDLLEAA